MAEATITEGVESTETTRTGAAGRRKSEMAAEAGKRMPAAQQLAEAGQDAGMAQGAMAAMAADRVHGALESVETMADRLWHVQRVWMGWLGAFAEAGSHYTDTMARQGRMTTRAHEAMLQQGMRQLVEGSVEVLCAASGIRSGGNGHSQERLGKGQEAGRVADVMTRHVEVLRPDDTVQDAARMMAEHDLGAVPVGEGDRLVGMVTDRDIAVRMAAQGKNPGQTRIREVMTADVKYVFEDEDVSHVVDNMAELQVRRLPVVDRRKRLVGVVSLGDLARAHRPRHVGRALRRISS